MYEVKKLSRQGGPGRGQGRPPKPGGAMPTRAIRMTNEEVQKVKEFLKELRKPSK